jgi:hypothetical protein
MSSLSLLLALSSTVPTALPFDLIANPLLKAPTGTDLQLEGDLKNLQPGAVRVNQAGYRLGDVRAGRARFLAIAATSPGTATLKGPGTDRTIELSSLNATVSSQVKIRASNSAISVSGGDTKTGYPKTGTTVAGTVYQGTLPSDLPPGTYTIQVGSDVSQSFVVSPKVYGMVRDASLMFFGVQRSGEGESWFHPASHLWDGWLFDTTGTKVSKDAYKGALSGGWYDCGDHLKETRTQSFALAMLGVTAATLPDQDADRFSFNHSASGTDGIPDVLRELKWGADFAIKAWNLAGGSSFRKDSLFLSVGDYGSDHGWWGRPEEQDDLASSRRGNRRERTIRKDWGSGSLADWAAGLAFASKLWKPYDRTGWSDSALKVAQDFYSLAKTTNKLESSPAYSGESKVSEDLALAANALFWATKSLSYLQDLAYTTGMPNGAGGTCGSSQAATFPASSFAGGFLGCGSDNMKRGSTNTDWASLHNPTLYAVHKLLLKDDATAQAFGITPTERAALEEKVVHNLIANLASVSASSGTSIPLPTSNKAFVLSNVLKVENLWGTMQTQQEWVWNRYHAGNLADLWMYHDMTGDIEASGTVLPNTSRPDWKRNEVLDQLLKGTNTLLGMNPWDMSWVLGVGGKNPMHPHHRAANPEGRINPNGLEYSYSIPVGALYGGKSPVGAGLFSDDWYTYFNTEVCLDGSATLTFLTSGLSRDTSTYQPPTTGTLRAAPQSSSLRARPAGDRILLSRTTGEVARLEILDACGEILSRQDWAGTELSVPRSRSLRIARLSTASGAIHLTLPPY